MAKRTYTIPVPQMKGTTIIVHTNLDNATVGDLDSILGWGKEELNGTHVPAQSFKSRAVLK